MTRHERACLVLALFCFSAAGFIVWLMVAQW